MGESIFIYFPFSIFRSSAIGVPGLWESLGRATRGAAHQGERKKTSYPNLGDWGKIEAKLVKAKVSKQSKAKHFFAEDKTLTPRSPGKRETTTK